MDHISYTSTCRKSTDIAVLRDATLQLSTIPSWANVRVAANMFYRVSFSESVGSFGFWTTEPHWAVWNYEHSKPEVQVISQRSRGNTNTPSEETMWSVHQDLFYFPQDLYFPRVPVIVQFSSLPLARLLFAAGLVCRWNYVLGLAGTFSLIDCQIKWLKLYVIHICVYTMYNK